MNATADGGVTVPPGRNCELARAVPAFSKPFQWTMQPTWGQTALRSTKTHPRRGRPHAWPSRGEDNGTFARRDFVGLAHFARAEILAEIGDYRALALTYSPRVREFGWLRARSNSSPNLACPLR